MHTVSGVEVFAPGKWNGREHTMADLHEMVRGWQATRAIHRPPLKLGHSEKQILAQEDGQPALGWMDNLRVAGGKLLADFVNVPTVVRDAIRQGRYRKVSAEFWLNVPTEKGKLPWVPKGVALLGSDLPAVTDLAGLETYLNKADFSAAESAVYTRDVETVPEPGDLAMDKAELKAALDEALKTFREQEEARFTALEAQHKADKEASAAELKSLREASGAAMERARVAEFSAQASAIKAEFEAKVKDGSLTPALRDEVFKAIDAQQATFTAGGKVSLELGLLGKVLAEVSPKLPKGELGESRKAQFAAGDPGTELNIKAMEAIAKAKLAGQELSFSDALNLVCSANPELAKAYHTAAIQAEPNAVVHGRAN